MTVFGEEKGLLGSRYYGRHPVVPIDKTAADVNLEQVGRTDDSEGPQVGTCAMTGFDFSDMVRSSSGGRLVGGSKFISTPPTQTHIWSQRQSGTRGSRRARSHSGVAFEFPDYHQVGDHWDKVDYDNMAKVDRMVTIGLLMIANSSFEPKWNEANPKAARIPESLARASPQAKTAQP